MGKPIIVNYKNDKKEYLDYIENKLNKELLESFYCYYEHDFIKLCKLAGNLAIWIEAIRSTNKNKEWAHYADDIFKNRIVLILKFREQCIFTYTAEDVIYTLRSFIAHGSIANMDNRWVLREFFLGYRFPVLASINLNDFLVFDKYGTLNHKIEGETANLNNHTFPCRDGIVLKIFKEINDILINKKFEKQNISWTQPNNPPEEFTNKIKENLKKYYR